MFYPDRVVWSVLTRRSEHFLAKILKQCAFEIEKKWWKRRKFKQGENLTSNRNRVTSYLIFYGSYIYTGEFSIPTNI